MLNYYWKCNIRINTNDLKEIIDWCRTQFGPMAVHERWNYCMAPYHCIWLMNEEDYVLFRLTWSDYETS